MLWREPIIGSLFLFRRMDMYFDFDDVIDRMDDGIIIDTIDDDGIDMPLVTSKRDMELDIDYSNSINVEEVVDSSVVIDSTNNTSVIHKVVDVDNKKKVSKLEVARGIYSREVSKGIANKTVPSRKDIIKLFISEAGCTTAGAATYYNTIKTS